MVNWGSPLFWLARGYAVLDGFAMPIVGEGEKHENDNYVEQLKLNAEAAVAELRRRGVSDHRLAVGGHSYGGFMTANLLARTDLFCAGIARNGAYNRTLTPFGFQSEERSFWEATPDTRARPLPSHRPFPPHEPTPAAGEGDLRRGLAFLRRGPDQDAAAAHPLGGRPQPGHLPHAVRAALRRDQRCAAARAPSMRPANTLRPPSRAGLGGTARLCVLPNEGHWYRARESIMHVLAEQDAWLEEHVRHAQPKAASAAAAPAPSKL